MARTNQNHLQTNFLAGEIPKMPEGFYSGDKPNANLRAFIQAHLEARIGDPETDDYDVPAFHEPIETTKATAMYNMHTYWSKKPHDAIQHYIRHYTGPGDVVLDPFCGSGSTAVAALVEGRKPIAIDRSPAATFITKNYCTPVDLGELQDAFEKLKAKVKPEIDWLYETRCDRCGGKATTNYTVFSQVFRCLRCNERVPLFDCTEVLLPDEKAGDKFKKVTVCPICYARELVEPISTRNQRFGSIPVLVSYSCENGCRPQRGWRHHNDADETKQRYFFKYDIGKIQEIEAAVVNHWYPPNKMMNEENDSKPWGAEWREGRNFRTVAELYTKRNLWALAAFRKALTEIALPESTSSAAALWMAITTVALTGTRMLREEKRAIQAGTYYLPATFREIKVANGIEYNVFQLTKAEDELRRLVRTQPELIISTQSALDLSSIQTSSIDYIFTDPPYAGKVQYGELNFIWEAWLGFETFWHDEEITVNEVRGKTENDWANMMHIAMAECYRVLKPGRWLTLCYHDTSEGTWALIQDIMAEAGFVVEKSDSALFIDSGQKSYNQLMADKVNKRDLVINFRKPRPGETTLTVMITGQEDQITFNEKVRGIICDFLMARPGSTKDRIFDEVVSRMVRAGSMEAHNFEELLSQVADEVREPVLKNLFEKEQPNFFGTHEMGRWYLKETEMEVVDVAESAKEAGAAKSVGDFIAMSLQKHPEQEGVHYGDIFEHFIYAVRDKPRRQLQDWLLDYFYKTPDGTYRLPNNDQENEAKACGRTGGTNRGIKRYVAFLQQGMAVPEKERASDATLVEWIRHCKRSGLYEQGKLLYERGGLNLDGLSEEAQVNVEEDYQTCARMLSRSNDGKQVKKGKERKGGPERPFQ